MPAVICTYECVCMCVRICWHKGKHTVITMTHTCVYVCVCVCVHVRVCVCACECMCVHVTISRHKRQGWTCKTALLCCMNTAHSFACAPKLAHTLTHSLTHSFTHSLTHSFTHTHKHRTQKLTHIHIHMHMHINLCTHTTDTQTCENRSTVMSMADPRADSRPSAPPPAFCSAWL
jgi:hypothetical protein